MGHDSLGDDSDDDKVMTPESPRPRTAGPKP